LDPSRSLLRHAVKLVLPCEWKVREMFLSLERALAINQVQRDEECEELFLALTMMTIIF
jgi:hypothetical protein